MAHVPWSHHHGHVAYSDWLSSGTHCYGASMSFWDLTEHFFIALNNSWLSDVPLYLSMLLLEDILGASTFQQARLLEGARIFQASCLFPANHLASLGLNFLIYKI